ncbi:MAG TPA: Flp pilus assembly protein CpaB [Arthrobacter sp.]|nr:Flp pilus assembly protein CpaB [Arthrobacter sp.]
MGRRTVLLVVAAVIAAVGTSLVFLYVRGADNRAQAAEAPVQVLKATAVINPGESVAAAQAAGKIAIGTVPRSQVLTGAVNTTSGMDNEVALTTIYPGEQVITSKFGAPGDQKVLTIPDGDIAISVSLSDTGRVAGFVSPGSDVAIFLTGSAAGDTQSGATAAASTSSGNADGTKLLLPKVEVIAVGATTVTSTTSTDPSGSQTTESLPKTLFTLAVDQDQAQKVIYASGHGELSFGLLTDKSKVKPGPATVDTNLFK